MTQAVCKACGETLGELDDFEPGDSVECTTCETGYEFVENPHDVYEIPQMLTDHDTVPDSPDPVVDSIESVEDGVVTWVRPNGNRVKDDVSDFHGDLPDGVTEG